MTKTLATYETLALKLLKKELGQFVESVHVEEKLDHADDPALFFDANLDETAPSDIGKKFIYAHFLLRNRLEAKGEMRFPYLTTRRPRSDNKPTDQILKYPEGAVSKRSANH